MHHIVADGWSIGILVKEVGALYEAEVSKRVEAVAELGIQYGDYAQWQREWMQGERLDAQLSYWKQKLGGNLPVLELPSDYPRSAARSYSGAAQSLLISKDLTEALIELSRQEKVTLFMTLLAAYETLLYRYTSQEDLIIGTPVANRSRDDIEGLIGNFVNMLALRTNLSGNPTFRELLARVSDVAWEAYAHQEMPFEKLVEMLQPERSLTQAPMFQVTFVFQNLLVEPAFELSNLTIRLFDLDIITPQYDFTLTIWEGAEDLTARLTYRADLFSAATISRILGNYEAVLRNVVKDPDARLKSIDMTTEAERQQRIARDKQRKEADLKKLIGTRPKPVKVSQEKLITTGYLDSYNSLPLVVQPGVTGIDLAAWAGKNPDYIEKELLKHGALLFRNFNIDSVERFEQFVRVISPVLFEYHERSSPRTDLGNQIYTSTDHPADQWIQMHSEHTYSHQWPMKLWFCCLQPAESGGETPIASNREVIKLLGPEIVERFRREKIMYLRNYGDGLGVPWQTAFQTADARRVEEYCLQARINFEWKSDSRLRTWQVREAVVTHPRTGELSWFNHSNIYNVASMGAEIERSLLTMFKQEDLPFNTYYGDGSPIEDHVLAKIRAAYTQAMITFPWQKGDVLMLDNILVAHGRRPYSGPRRVIVAMGDLFSTRAS
jgi:alpha-ketoglutarate-dependent taurine dioxygenase